MSFIMLSKIFLTVWLGLGLNFMKNMQVVYIKILIRFNLKLLINKIVNQKSFYNLYNKRCALQWKNLPTDTNIALNIFYRVLSESFAHLSELLFTGSRKLQLPNLIMSLSLDLRLLLMTPRHRSKRVKPLDPGTFLLMAQATTGLSSSDLFNY